jgi:predicted DNA-binding protein
MPHGEHREVQTAFRLPEGLLAWLREQAKAEDRTMTAIVRRALEEYRRQAADREP